MNRIYHQPFQQFSEDSIAFARSCVKAPEYFDESIGSSIWQPPIPGAEYSIGVTVAEGLGLSTTGEYGEKLDPSVVYVNRIGNGNQPHEQVAAFVSYSTDPIELAKISDRIGRKYNDALLAVECNRFDITLSELRFRHKYPNLFRWKHLDSDRILSNKWGWWTNESSKTRLYFWAKRSLSEKLWIVRSSNLCDELNLDGRVYELPAALIALYVGSEFKMLESEMA